MNGIEKIIDKILADAKSYADRVLSEAEAGAGDIITDAETAAAKLKTDARLRAEKEAENILGRVSSSSQLIERNCLLEAKSVLIDRTFETAKQKILNMDRNAYDTFLSSLLAEAVADVPDDKHIMSVNKKDRETAQRVIHESSADIILSDTDALIEGGFILRRGDVEINCSLELIISGLRDTLESEVYKALFN